MALPPHTSPSSASAPPLGSRRGFALLITITLLAFLVLLLVSLASLTRVETQVASNNQQLAQARQNALMALNIALGQLQKYAGPDQRVTATADLAGDSAGAKLADGTTPSTTVGETKYWDSTSTSNGLSRIQSGTRYWTGVWGNRDFSAPTSGNGNIYEKNPRPVLLNWLVSGNENASFNVTAGQITATNIGSGAFLPGGGVTLPSSATTTGTVANAAGASTPAVLLVGPASVGTANQPTTSEVPTDRYVVAPLVDLTSSSMPGLSGSTTIGRYAYWVGDEGVKARINLTDRYADQTNASSSLMARYRLQTAPRSGLEVVSDFSSANYPSETQSATLTNNIATRALSLPQATMMDPQMSSPKLQARFHDLTTRSVGVLADSYNGGLRKDLTYHLEQNTLPIWTGSNGQNAGKDQGIIPAAYSPVMNTLTTSDKRVPRWDIINSFYNLPKAAGSTLTGSVSDSVQVRPATATQMGITPMVVQMRILGGVAGNATATASVATSEVPSLAPRTRRQMMNVMIVLANPYPVTLSAPNGINVQFNNDTRITTGSGSGGNNIRLWIVDGNFDVGWLQDVLGGGANRVKLHIPAFTLAKGEAAAFYISGQQLVINGSNTTVPMVQMTGTPPNLGGSSFRDYVYCDYGGWNTALTNVRVRLAETGVNATMIAEFSDPNTSALLMQVGGINPNRASSGAITYHQISFNPQSTTPANYPVFSYFCQYNEPGDPFPYGSNGSLGEGSTALRAWADFNPRAGYYRVTNYGYTAAPYVQYFTPGGNELQDFSTGLVTAYWGRSIGAVSSMASATVSKAILFDFPRKTSSSSTEPPFMSLAALQHASLDAEDIPSTSATTQAAPNYNNYTWEFGSASTVSPVPGHQPAYAVGNSYASSFLPRSQAVFTPDATNYTYQMDNWASSVNAGSSAQVARNYYDISYLLNVSLWDGYFISTIPQTGSDYAPVNPRLGLRSDVSTSASLVRDGDRAAAYTTIEGAFNINSTSVDAWTAVLGGMKNLPKIPGLSSSGSNAATVFPRSLWQITDAVAPPTGTGNDSYSGYRQLTDTDIRALAVEIVKQVRMRGPFVSLSHFINRVLVDANQATETTAGLGQSGALQSAIDKAGLNAFSDAAASVSNDQTVIPTASDDAVLSESGARGTFSYYADKTAAGVPTQLNRSTGIPGWLTQADVLQAIGPVIAARSDTFVIRTYGEVLDPVNSTAANPVVIGRAWCEAVVQRLPEYVADAAISSSSGDPAQASFSSLQNSSNQSFGRRFKVVSFRWLSPQDI